MGEIDRSLKAFGIVVCLGTNGSDELTMSYPPVERSPRGATSARP